MEPKPEFNLHQTPQQLRGNAIFQAAFRTTKPYLQDMLLGLQRAKSRELKEDKEELGRQILIIADVMELLDSCGESEIQSTKQRIAHKPLNNA